MLPNGTMSNSQVYSILTRPRPKQRNLKSFSKNHTEQKQLLHTHKASKHKNKLLSQFYHKKTLNIVPETIFLIIYSFSQLYQYYAHLKVLIESSRRKSMNMSGGISVLPKSTVWSGCPRIVPP